MIKTAKRSDSHAKVGASLAPWEVASQMHDRHIDKIDRDLARERRRESLRRNETEASLYNPKYKQA